MRFEIIDFTPQGVSVPSERFGTSDDIGAAMRRASSSQRRMLNRDDSLKLPGNITVNIRKKRGKARLTIESGHEKGSVFLLEADDKGKKLTSVNSGETEVSRRRLVVPVMLGGSADDRRLYAVVVGKEEPADKALNLLMKAVTIASGGLIK